MKGKNGFLLAEETLKIVIAVISIGFLVYFLSALYFSNRSSAELEQAKASLEFLIKEINAGSGEVILYNPKGWVLTSWSENKLPNRCSNIGWKECICMNEDLSIPNKGASKYLPLTNSVKDKTFNKINEEGTCLQSDYKVQGESIKIENPPISLLINKENKEISRK